LDKRLNVSSSPHIRHGATTQKIMLNVIIALLPATLAGIYFFGARAALLIFVTVLASVGFEYLSRLVLKRNNTIGDLSAVVTGLLLALNLPPTLPIWMAVVGAFFAIVIVKQLFGGLGYNFVNPALAARAFLLVSFGSDMSKWTEPINRITALAAEAVSGTTSGATSGATVDVSTYATPLSILKDGGEPPSLLDMFLGQTGGSVGEVCALAIIIGGLYLIIKGVISWHIPVIYTGTVALMAWVLGPEGMFTGYALYHVLAGGLLLGAFFMATDYTTSPMTKKGTVIYALGCGLLTIVFRLYTGMPEGVSYAILLMNVATPLIDRLTRPRRFGGATHV